MNAANLCHYHPAEPARWHCPSCNFGLCRHCAQKHPNSSVPLCIACKSQTESLGSGGSVKPFWERIPKFFLYPAKMGPLMMAGGLSLAFSLILLPMPWFVRIFIFCTAMGMMVRYCYHVLLHTARGHLEPPEGTGSEFGGVFWQQFFLFLILFGGAGFIAGMLDSPAMDYVLSTAVLLLLPAAIITLGIQGSLGAAINPITLLRVATSIGWPYLLMWVMLMLLTGSQSLVIQFLAPGMPVWMLIGTLIFVSCYFSIAMFHMMGYVVFQYHDELGFTPDEDYEDSAEAAQDRKGGPVITAPDEVQILITDGRYEEAGKLLYGQLQDNRDDLRLHERYFRLNLTQPERKEDGVGHADFYIGKLVEKQQVDKALNTYKDATARWGAFEIKDAGDAVAMASLAQQRGDAKTALPILARFPQRFPGHVRIPAAMLLSAEILANGMGRDDMALRILEQLQKAYPEHELRPRIDALHGVVQRLAQRKAAASSAPGSQKSA